MKALAQPTSSADRRRPLSTSLQQVRRLQTAGQSQQAEHVLRQLLEQEPDNHEALFRLAAIAYEAKFYESALELLDRALAADGRHADYHALRGRVLRVQGNLDQAVACFRQALAIKPDTPKVLVSLGIALRRLGRLHEAAEALRKAIRPCSLGSRYSVPRSRSWGGRKETIFGSTFAGPATTRIR